MDTFRTLLRTSVDKALREPPRDALDGFAQRRGPAWEGYQRGILAFAEEAARTGRVGSGLFATDLQIGEERAAGFDLGKRTLFDLLETPKGDGEPATCAESTDQKCSICGSTDESQLRRPGGKWTCVACDCAVARSFCGSKDLLCPCNVCREGARRRQKERRAAETIVSRAAGGDIRARTRIQNVGTAIAMSEGRDPEARIAMDHFMEACHKFGYSSETVGFFAWKF